MRFVRRHAPLVGAVAVSVLGAVAVVVVAFVEMPGDEDVAPVIGPEPGSTGAASATPQAHPSGLREVRVRQGDVARFRVRADRTDRVRVRGLGIERDVRARRVTKLAFRARRVGTFVVEMQRSGFPIGVIEVSRR